jgi:glycosyltransferase involved in cell wall biosynthesis
VVSGRRNEVAHESFGIGSGLVDGLMRRWTDAVVANSQSAAAYAVTSHRTDPRRLHVIRNGVEPAAPWSVAERDAKRASMGALAGDVLIGCVANLRVEKRHDALLTTFSELLRELPGLRLILVGDGPCRPDIERRIQALGIGERVHLCGNVPDARPLYPAFDIVVQASESEGMPNAVLEAAAAGRPIVATAAGGTVEIVTDGETGLLVPVDDIGALGSGIRRLVLDDDLRGRVGEAARTRTESMFGMERFVREFAELYEALFQNRVTR